MIDQAQRERFSPTGYHQALLEGITPKYAYDGGDVRRWQRTARRKLWQLLGYRAPAAIPLQVRTLWQQAHPLGHIEKLVYTSERGVEVPAYFCRPRHAAPPYPVMICLQGHTSGMHHSIGVTFEDERVPMVVEGDRDFALGCLARGIAYLRTRDDVDRARLGIMGNSAGGTTALYAAALLPQLRYVMPSCALCSFRASWMAIYHCVCRTSTHIWTWRISPACSRRVPC